MCQYTCNVLCCGHLYVFRRISLERFYPSHSKFLYVIIKVYYISKCVNLNIVVILSQSAQLLSCFCASAFHQLPVLEVSCFPIVCPSMHLSVMFPQCLINIDGFLPKFCQLCTCRQR